MTANTLHIDDKVSGDGILQPVLIHRWTLATTLPEECDILLRTQAIRCSMDIVNKRFTLELSQPMICKTSLFGVIKLMSEGETTITLMAIDGLTVNHEIVTITARLVSHKYELDYAGPSDESTHKLEFSF